MTEPDWSTAPLWAMWFVFDSDGEAWWYETKPYIKTKYGLRGHEFNPKPKIYWSCETGRFLYAGNYQKLAKDWQNSLEGEMNDRT